MMKARKQLMKYGKPMHPNNLRMQQLQQQQYLQSQAKRSEVLNHDVAEAMNFRMILSQTFTRNQELLETLLERDIPIRNIDPPPAFPEALQYKAEDVTSLWAGNLQRAQEILAELENDTKEEEAFVIDEDFKYRQELLLKLRDLPKNIEKVEDLNPHVKEIAKDFAKLRGVTKQYCGRGYTRKQLPHLRPNDYSEAPPGWYEQQLEMKAALQKKQEEEMRLKQEEIQRRMAQQNALMQNQVTQGFNQQSQVPSEGMNFNYDPTMGGEMNPEMFNTDFMDTGFGMGGSLDNDFLSQL